MQFMLYNPRCHPIRVNCEHPVCVTETAVSYLCIDQYPRRDISAWIRNVWESTHESDDGSHVAATAHQEWTPDTSPRCISR